MQFACRVFLALAVIVSFSALPQEAVASENCPFTEGMRIRHPDHPEVYLILDGVRRHVPSIEVFNRLFRTGFSTVRVSTLIECVKLGSPLRTDTQLWRHQGRDAVYLKDLGFFRHVVSMEVFDRFDFDMGKVYDHPGWGFGPIGSQIR